MYTYMVLGVEAFNLAQVRGMFSNKKAAQEMANILEKEKSCLCCQRYIAVSWTTAKKYELYS